MCPDKPLIVWHRSFHELFANSEALRGTEFEDEEALRSHPQVMMMMMMMIILITRWTIINNNNKNNPQVDWDTGHFFEAHG